VNTVRDAALGGHGDLAVQDGAAHRQLGEELGDRAEAAGRVVAGPALDPDSAALEVGDDPVPVVLDLVHRACAGGRLRSGAGELGPDSVRNSNCIESALRELDAAGLGIRRWPGRRSETELHWVAGQARTIL
jgi:hypothetical protein